MAGPVWAQPKTETDEGKPGATPLVHEGHSGVWFPLESAKRLRKIQLDYPYQLQRVSQFQQLLTLRGTEIDKLRVIVTSEKKIADDRALRLQQVAKEKAELETQLTSFYRNPYVWFVAGLVVGGGAIVAVTR